MNVTRPPGDSGVGRNTVEAVSGRGESQRPSQGNWITVQAKLVGAAKRDHRRSLEATGQGTGWSQELGKVHQLAEGWHWLWALRRGQLPLDWGWGRTRGGRMRELAEQEADAGVINSLSRPD